MNASKATQRTESGNVEICSRWMWPNSAEACKSEKLITK